MTGKANDLEWIREGHRSYPLIARAPPYSALHILAEHASKAAAAENSSLPEPCDTRRTRTLDHEIPGKHIIMDDPTLPPPSPSVFGINRKELKKTYEMSTLQQTSRKKHYSMLKPPPPPNLKIQHLYQTLNTKRPRKSLTKKSSKIKKSSPSSRIQMHSPATQSTAEQKNFDNAELHRHLTSKLMPPPMSPMKSPTSQYQPILPATNKQRGNMQNIEPQAHYIPNNPSRLKSELLAGVTSPNKKQRVKSVGNLQTRNNYLQKFANGAGARMDHIPDPQIIFNTSSSSSSASSLSSSTSATVKIENEEHHHNQHEIDMSSQASPLQLLSTAASCTPKLKVNSSSPHQQQFQTIKTNVPNRAIKIIPTNSKPVVIKSTVEIKNQQQPLQQQQQSKIKIQKFQLMMNKNQDGTTSTANLSPTATIVSSKGGQFVLSGKNITNSYQVGKSPYAIVTTPKTTPKVVVQTMKENSDTNDNQIEFATNSNFPKVIIKSPATTTSTQGKQIKLKLGTSIVNTKILTKPLTSFTIQRNVNTKGFTVLNPSHIVQIQQQQQQLQQSSQSTPISITTTTSTTPNTPTESTKVDWEQELDDVNRTKGGKSQSKSNGSGTVVKKIKLDETTSASEEISQQENVIVETVDEIHDEDIQSTNQIVVFGKYLSMKFNYHILIKILAISRKLGRNSRATTE